MKQNDKQKKEKRNKVLKILKFALDITIYSWALILTISLVIGSCSTKKTKSTSEEITLVDRDFGPNNMVIQGDGNGGGQWTSSRYIEVLTRYCSMVGANERGSSYAYYTWRRGEPGPRFDDITGPLEVNATEPIGVVDLKYRSSGSTSNIIFDKLRLNSNSYTLDIYYEDEIIESIDQRDFDQGDVYDSININFYPMSTSYISGQDFTAGMLCFEYGYIGSTQYGASLSSMLGIDNVLNKFFQKQVYDSGSGSGGGDSSVDGFLGFFELISTAFEAIGPFLAISIIPGVTFGTMLALPLLFTLIMFIVKLFKR